MNVCHSIDVGVVASPIDDEAVMFVPGEKSSLSSEYFDEC